MKITENFLSMGKEHGRTGQPLAPKGVVVHWVANPKSSAAGNRNYFENGAGGNYTSAHYIVGLEGEVLLVVPENERAQHAVQGNSLYLGIEVCHWDWDGKFSDVTYDALVELCGDICLRYGFDPMKDILRHFDVTGKECPRYYVRNPEAWERLKVDIKNKMEDEVVRFNTIEEVPEYGQDTIKKLIEKGFLKGGDSGLDLTETMLRIFVVHDRAGIYGE